MTLSSGGHLRDYEPAITTNNNQRFTLSSGGGGNHPTSPMGASSAIQNFSVAITKTHRHNPNRKSLDKEIPELIKVLEPAAGELISKNGRQFRHQKVQEFNYPK